jgi:hydroxymethylpyrimidine pyrophosphatase-like HAD family hydrolase
MSAFKLLSTDFDGTLIGHFSDGRCTAGFAESIMRHKRRGGRWAVNTGRSLWHAIEGLDRFHAPVAPDFLLCNERDIFHHTPEGRWIPEKKWNASCEERHADLFDRIGPLIDSIHELAAGHPGINVVEENGLPSGVITSDEEVMHLFVEFLESEAAAFPDFSYQRNTIYLRFSHRDHHKGSALGELARLLDIAADDIFAAGDHFNDIPMLDGRFAAFPSCPSNAIPEVRETVRQAGGHIASKPAADGVVESLGYFAERAEA